MSALKVEVATYENVLADKTAVIDKYESEKGQNKGAEETLHRQLEEQKQAAVKLQADVAGYQKLVAEETAVIDKLEAERKESKAAEEGLVRQLEEQKQKNNVSSWGLLRVRWG